jgi:hypothetical protein
MRKVEVDLTEVLLLFNTLEKLQQFFHQPLHVQSLDDLANFLSDEGGGAYRELHNAYYNLVWNWLPPDIKAEIESR